MVSFKIVKQLFYNFVLIAGKRLLLRQGKR